MQTANAGGDEVLRREMKWDRSGRDCWQEGMEYSSACPSVPWPRLSQMLIIVWHMTTVMFVRKQIYNLSCYCSGSNASTPDCTTYHMYSLQGLEISLGGKTALCKNQFSSAWMLRKVDDFGLSSFYVTHTLESQWPFLVVLWRVEMEWHY